MVVEIDWSLTRIWWKAWLAILFLSKQILSGFRIPNCLIKLTSGFSSFFFLLLLLRYGRHFALVRVHGFKKALFVICCIFSLYRQDPPWVIWQQKYRKNLLKKTFIHEKVKNYRRFVPEEPVSYLCYHNHDIIKLIKYDTDQLGLLE